MIKPVNQGVFALPRDLFSSIVWRGDPNRLKLFVWLVGMANHTDVKKNGYQYRRGQVVTTYQKIVRALTYRKGRETVTPTLKKVRYMLQWLENNGFIRVEHIRTGGDSEGQTSRADSGAYLGLKIIVVNYDTYQPKKIERGRLGGIPPGQYNNNDSFCNNNDVLKHTATEIFDFYLAEIQPEQKTRQRALSNIGHHLKSHAFDALKTSVSNYATIAVGREPRFRQDPANFFQKREPAFVDYLPGTFQAPQTQKKHSGFKDKHYDGTPIEDNWLLVEKTEISKKSGHVDAAQALDGRGFLK